MAHLHVCNVVLQDPEPMNHNVIFRTITGSQSYGTATPTSDTDYKGVYLQPVRDLVGFGYVEQVEVGKDDCMWEGRRFVQLLQSANPTVLELLFAPEDCVITMSPAFRFIQERRYDFLTKQCAKSFGGYAVAQIRNARGLDKKMNWERNRVIRKTPLDFCFVVHNGRSMALADAMDMHRIADASMLGLAAIDRFRDAYAVYVDRDGELGYRGVCAEDGNDVHLSSIPKGKAPWMIMSFNKDAYSTHCKDYLEYVTWEKNRNAQRYVDTVNHGQMIDGKNLLHCRRLIDMGMEIAKEGVLTVRRPNAEHLLAIRRGEVKLDDILSKAEEDLLAMDEAYAKCRLPDCVDKDWANEALINMRTINGDL